MSKPLLQQVCERARRLVDDPRTWTQFAIAQTGNHKACKPNDTRAVRFCAYGAILRAANDIAGNEAAAEQLTDQAAKLVTGQDNVFAAFEDLIGTNDGPRATARQDVLALFERAAAKV